MKIIHPKLQTQLSFLILFLPLIFQGQNVWNPVGPFENNLSNKFSVQAGISKIALSKSDPNLILAGTSYGEIYKSTNNGNSWENISLSLPTTRSIKLLKLHPSDNKIIFTATRSRIYYSEDSGASWTVLYEIDNLNPRAIHIDPNNNSIVVTGIKGTFFSSDMGLNWTETDPDEGFDLIAIPDSPKDVYLLKSSSTGIPANLVKSTNSGESFSTDQMIWDQDPITEIHGGKLSISGANPNKIFIYLSGNQQTSDNNNLGLWQYKIDSETLTRVYNGGPYFTNHPNLITTNNQSSFSKGNDYINLIANPLNSDELILGSINLFSSSDGGLNFIKNTYISSHAPVGYYMNVLDIASSGNMTYIATDGGIYKSDNFFKDGNYEVITSNIQGTYCYDLAHAWHNRTFVSSAKDIGSFAKLHSYQSNQVKYTGGIENTFTALNLYNERIFFNQELKTVIIPDNILSSVLVNANSFNIEPNSNKLPVNNTSLIFHPNNYKRAFVGQQNQLLRSENGGHNFFNSYSFDAAYKITELEISRKDPDLMLAVLQHKSTYSNAKKIMRSLDGGASWTALQLPSEIEDKHLLIALDGNDSDAIYLSSKNPSNNTRLLKSNDKGQTWQAINTNGLPNQFYHDLLFLTGYENPLVICTEKNIYRFKNNVWESFNSGLPTQINISKGIFYYKEGIMQISSYGKGLWALEIDDPQLQPKATLSVEKREADVNCIEDAIFHFFDYSMVNKDIYTLDWDYGNGFIVSEEGDYKKNISFSTSGIHTVKLSILDSLGTIIDSDSLTIDINIKQIDSSVEIDFESNSDGIGLDDEYYHFVSERTHSEFGGYGNSTSCFWLNNKTANSNKKALIPIAVDLSDFQNPVLEFDLAYAKFSCVEDYMLVTSKTCDNGQAILNQSFNSETLKSTEIQEFDFKPNANQWKKVSIPLDNLAHANRAFIFIEQLTPQGNNLFIDNIKIKNLPE